jgi:tetracycline repressor-like protein
LEAFLAPVLAMHPAFHARQQWMVAHNSEAQTLGELRADEDPSQLAFELDAYMLMGNTAFVLHDDPAYLHRARAAVSLRLEQATRASAA